MKIAFDVGGVLSKHKSLRSLFLLLSKTCPKNVYIISDMHPREKIIEMLKLNKLECENIYSADYSAHGEDCKRVLCENLGINVLIDDFIGYVAEGEYTRLLVMPNPKEPYYSDDWLTDGSEGNFGRRKK